MHVTLCTCVLVPGETIDNASSGAGAMDRRQPSHMGTGTELKSSGGTLPQSSSAFHPDCLSVNQIPTARPAPSDPPSPYAPYLCRNSASPPRQQCAILSTNS